MGLHRALLRQKQFHEEFEEGGPTEQALAVGAASLLLDEPGNQFCDPARQADQTVQHLLGHGARR